MMNEMITLRDGRAVQMRMSCQGDAQCVHDYICELGRTTSMILTCEQDLPALERIQSHIDLIPSGGFYSLVAIDPETQRVVGNVSFRFAERMKLKHIADLGMGVLTSHRRTGLGALMLDRAIEDMRQRPDILRLELTTLTTNIHAHAMYKRVGFIDEGIKRRSLMQPDGRFEDEIIMGMWVGE